jgi:hypothetical protein
LARFEDLLSKVFNAILQLSSISEMIARFSVVIAMLETEEFETGPYCHTSKVQKESSVDEKIMIAAQTIAINEFVMREAAGLRIHSYESYRVGVRYIG